MAGEWLEMMTQQITPAATHVAVLYNPETAPFADLMLRAIQDASKQVTAVVHAEPVHDEAGIATVIEKLSREERGGLLVLPDSFTMVHRAVIVAAAARARAPAVYWNSAFIMEGGLMSYGIVQPDLFQDAARYIDRILKGTRPGDLPVQNPTKFEIVINLKTALALGITVDPTLVASADNVIE
jgi:putative ABC transport system substrate-binding protein